MKKLITVGLFTLALGSTDLALASKHSNRVEAENRASYTEIFHRGQEATVSLQGDGDTVLRLKVYDSSWKLVVEDACKNNECSASWTINRTQPYRIVVDNSGNVWNAYDLTTDERDAGDEY